MLVGSSKKAAGRTRSLAAKRASVFKVRFCRPLSTAWM